MKRNLIFAIGALGIGILAAIAVLSYAYFYPRLYVEDENGEYVNVETTSQKETFPVTTETIFQIEYYYPDEEKRLTEEITEFPELLGCDKDGVIKYLDYYMQHLSKEEQEKGLQFFELASYHDNVLCLRKTYRRQGKKGYYAKSFNGMIVILNGDERTVYEYTQISIHLLPEELKEEVRQGYYLENEEELYSFLENYSS